MVSHKRDYTVVLIILRNTDLVVPFQTRKFLELIIFFQQGMIPCCTEKSVLRYRTKFKQNSMLCAMCENCM